MSPAANWMTRGDAALDAALRMTLKFGKHDGCTLRWVIEHDPSYLTWLVEQGIKSQTLHDAVKLVLTAYDQHVRAKANEAEMLR